MAKKKDGTSDRVFMQNAIRTLVANIQFASVDAPINSMVVTSSVPNEGKTTISIALAQALAQGGKTVLLVECDMRRRSIAAALGVHGRTGVYSVLSGQSSLEDAVVETPTRGLFFLDCEPHIPNPVDILSSKRFQRFARNLRESYDYVVIDTPPLSTFVDAAVISTVVDGTLLVVRQDFVKRDEVAAAYDQLQKAEAHVIGVVLNYSDNERNDYYYSYYNKEGKRDGSHDAPQAPAPASVKRGKSVVAHSPAPSRADKSAAARPQDVEPTTGVPGLKPLPTGTAARVAPDSTAQFLVGTPYQSHIYTEE